MKLNASIKAGMLNLSWKLWSLTWIYLQFAADQEPKMDKSRKLGLLKYKWSLSWNNLTNLPLIPFGSQLIEADKTHGTIILLYWQSQKLTQSEISIYFKSLPWLFAWRQVSPFFPLQKIGSNQCRDLQSRGLSVYPQPPPSWLVLYCDGLFAMSSWRCSQG